MSDKSRDPSTHLDDALAAFSDRLLSGELSGSQEMFAQDQELRELQETAVRLHRAFESAEPPQAMADRIHDNLVAEWREAGLGVEQIPFWRRWLQSDRRPADVPIARRRPAYALAMAAAIVLLGILASLLIPTIAPELTSTAGGGGDMFWLIFVLGIVVAGVVWWGARRKR
jgi:hypothetical protein